MNTASKLFFLSVLLIVIGCDDNGDSNPTTSSGNDKLGFVVASYVYWEEDDWLELDVEIFTMDLPEVIPEVTVNGLTTQDFWLEEGLWWDWDINISMIGKSIPYSIKWKGDELAGTIIIPGMVSSVTCNGVSINNNDYTDIELSSTYIFNWQAPSGENNFSIDFYDNFWEINGEFWNKRVTGTTYTLNLETNSDDNRIHFDISVVGSPEIKAGSTPNVSGSKMFAYYDLQGAEFECRLDVVSQGLPKKSNIIVEPRKQPIISRKDYLKKIKERLGY